MKKTFFIQIVVAFLLGLTALYGDAKVLEENQGMKRLLIDDAKYNRMMGGNITTGSTNKPTEVIVIKTLRGVMNAQLPDWLEVEFLIEAGYQGKSLSSLTDKQLDASIDTVVIDISGLNKIKSKIKSKMQKYGKSYVIEKYKGWGSRHHKSLSKNFTKTVKSTDLYEKGNVKVGFNGNFKVDGSVKAKLEYQRKYKYYVPYKVRINWIDIDADAKVRSTMKLEGYAKYKLSKKLFEKKLKLWSYTWDYWLYFVEINVDLDLNLDIGANLDVEAKADIKTDDKLNGDTHLSWRCTSRGCDKTRNQSNFTFVQDKNKPSYGVAVKATVTPYIDVNFEADLDLYYGIIDIASAKIGVVAGLPVTVFGYYGNTCSDADNDGTSEKLKSILVDVNAEMYGYIHVTVLNKKFKNPLHFSILGWEPLGAGYLSNTKNFKGKLYRKHLYYKSWDTGDGYLMDSVMTLAKTIPQKRGKIVLKPRSCYPFNDKSLTYEIDWGDGSSHTTGTLKSNGTNGTVYHNWLTTGPKIVRVRTIKGSEKRKVKTDWIEKRITVGSSAGITLNAPTRLTLSKSNTTSAVLYFTDNSSNETHFRLYNNGKYLKTINGKSGIGNHIFTTLSGLKANTTYKITVKAYDSKSRKYSKASNERIFKTLALSSPKSKMTSPTNGSRTLNSTTTFKWTKSGSNKNYLYIGTRQGSNNIYRGYVYNGSKTISRLKAGQYVYVRLWTRINNRWQYNDYRYYTKKGAISLPVKSKMTSPTNGSRTLNSTTTFKWTKSGSNKNYLYIGTRQGSNNIYRGYVYNGYKTIRGLKAGQYIYVRLWTRINNRWQYNDYKYKRR